MRIKVTQKHIDAGKKRSCVACPIALAIRDAVECDERIFVGEDDAHFRGEWRKISQRTSEFIIAFDAGKPVKPFSFNLKI